MADHARLIAALQSIADNSCCSGCQEAALVARAALREVAAPAPDPADTRAYLTGIVKGFAAGENAESRRWRERAELAEAENARLRAEVQQARAAALSGLSRAHLAALAELADDLESILQEVSGRDGDATARQRARAEAVRAALAMVESIERHHRKHVALGARSER